MLDTAPSLQAEEIAVLFTDYNVPALPHFRELVYDDKNLVEKMLAVHPSPISELNFTNLYCWHHAKNISLSFFEHALVLQTNPENQEPYLFPPIGQINIHALIQKIQEFPAIPHKIRFIDEERKGAFKDFPLTEDRDYWDYIYPFTDLAYLQGRKFSKKRNHINQFLREYSEYELHPVHSGVTNDIDNFLEKWCYLRKCCDDEHQCYEFKAVKKCLKEWDNLSCQGGYITINDSIEAFIVAERLNRDTAVIHFEKANPDIAGLYQVINKDYTARYLGEYKWINREQDMGLPGLRQAKESYHPSHYIKKYSLVLS